MDEFVLLEMDGDEVSNVQIESEVVDMPKDSDSCSLFFGIYALFTERGVVVIVWALFASGSDEDVDREAFIERFFFLLLFLFLLLITRVLFILGESLAADSDDEDSDEVPTISA